MKIKLATARIMSNEKVMPDTYLMWLEAPEIAAEAKPGQFVMVRCGDGYEHMLRRPISIHGTYDDRIALLYRTVGKGTVWLARRKPGEALELTGPSGNGFTVHPPSRYLLLVAGGIGIAPILFLAREALNERRAITLLYGTASAQRYPDILLPLGITIVAATDNGTVGHKGMITEIIPDYIDSADQVFACGPVGMYQYMAARKQELFKGKPCQVSLEMRMACGHGVCYGCTVRTKQRLKQVCKDGPVFELDDIIIDELVC
ncbi:MAG: dihydroorotate dehydrogenase electron transfer subunit [Chloroflexota bacterium]